MHHGFVKSPEIKDQKHFKGYSELSIEGNFLGKEVEISKLRNWGRPKKKSMLPLFLLPPEKRKQLLYSKNHARGRPTQESTNHKNK
jgi:hypothetical protein